MGEELGYSFLLRKYILDFYNIAPLRGEGFDAVYNTRN
jgi:hypothetical protein